MPGLKVVIEEDGQTREITGWRKWAITIPVLAAVALLGGVAALFILGVVVTVGAVLLAAVPIALILALIAYTFVRSTARSAAH